MAWIEFEKDRKTIASWPRWAKWTIGTSAALVIGVLLLPDVAQHSKTMTAEAPAAAPAEPARRRFDPAAVAAAKASIAAEPKVKDLLYDPIATVQWHVGVLNDGSPRFGYAEYLCTLAREHGAADDNTWLRVVDISKVARGVDFRSASLGTIRCGDGTRLDDAPAAGA